MAAKTLRAFIAIELDDHLRGKLKRLSSDLGRAMPPRAVRWTRPEAIHITLKFLGEISETRVPEILAVMGSAAQTAGPPFSCAVGGLGCFPNFKQPRIVWVGLHELTGGLSRLQKAVENGVARLGYAPEDRPFSPHLTIGRLARDVSPPDRRRVGEVAQSTAVGELGTLAAAWVSLIKSELKPGGSEYTRIGRAQLSGAAA